MTEQNAGTEQKPAQAESSEQPTLESLYDQYSVTAPQSTPERVATVPEQKPGGDTVAAIHKDVAAFRAELAAERAETARTRDEADLKKAIAALQTESDIEGKDTILRGFLIAKATEDQRLRTLWENRRNNPQAWEKALKILGGEVKKEFAVPDPQLEENQRAMEESQRAQSTSAPPRASPEQEVLRMKPAEFAQYWSRLSRRG